MRRRADTPGARSQTPHSSFLDQTTWPLSPFPCPPSSARPSRYVASSHRSRNPATVGVATRGFFREGCGRKSERERRAGDGAALTRRAVDATASRGITGVRSSLAIRAVYESGKAARRPRAARGRVATSSPFQPPLSKAGWAFPTRTDGRHSCDDGACAPRSRARARPHRPRDHASASREFVSLRVHPPRLHPPRLADLRPPIFLSPSIFNHRRAPPSCPARLSNSAAPASWCAGTPATADDWRTMSSTQLCPPDIAM